MSNDIYWRRCKELWAFGIEYEAYVGDRMLVWIEARPDYCDRGHYVAQINAVPFAERRDDIDSADAFPRYFMRLEIAKQEMDEWLRWRLWKERV